MAYYKYRYPRPCVTTDCVVFALDGTSLSVLLIERGGEPFKGCWAFPGGFLNMDESAEACAARELCEETGLKGVAVHQFHAFSAPDRDPRGRVITIAFYALVHRQAVKGGDDAARAEWFPLDDLPPLAFDHSQVLRGALEAVDRQIRLGLLPESLSSSELQSLRHALAACGETPRVTQSVPSNP